MRDVEQSFEGKIPLTEIESFQLEEINILSVVIVFTVLALGVGGMIAIGNSRSEFNGN